MTPHFRLIGLAALSIAAGCASLPAPAATPATPSPATAHASDDHQDLLVIAHRGASGYRPEHTLEAYRLAIRMGADFIEPDLVATRDGVLVARHENEISGTTDVAAHPEFAARRTTKTVDGVALTGWFTEDFTLAELKTLRARERIPEIRPRNKRYDGQFQIPTFAEVLQLAKRESRHGRAIGVIPETKHPTYFLQEGRRLDGRPIRMSLGEKLIETLVAEGFTDPKRVIIQSFEVQNLIDLERRVMPNAGVHVPLAQLYDDFDAARPYDMVYNASHGADLVAIYGDLGASVEGGITADTHYGALATRPVLRWMKSHYASVFSPWKNSLVPRVALASKVDANGDGKAELATRNTGRVHPALANALAVGLDVIPYTMRAEESFLTQSPTGVSQAMLGEAVALYGLGVRGMFFDQPDIGVAARDIFLDINRP